MKSRQLNKLYQMMRVSRFYNRHKSNISGAPLSKRVIKSYNDRLDELLIDVLKQKEDITYGARETNALRESLTQIALSTSKLTGIYLLENNEIMDYHSINFSYTGLKSLCKQDFTARCGKILGIVIKHAKATKDYGVKQKDIARFRELHNRWQKNMILPRKLRNTRINETKKVFSGLKELNEMQRTKLDKISACFFESAAVKSEYRRVRKYVNYKNPHEMLDVMLKWYRGAKRKKINTKQQAVSNELKIQLPELKVQNESIDH